MTTRCAVAFLIALASMAGCVSTMVSTREELQSLSEDEGVVIGSVLVTVEKEPGREAESLVKGWLAERMDWSIFIWETGLNPFKTSYSVVARPGREEVFIRKLPAGSYRIDRIEYLFPGSGSRPPDPLEFSVAAYFSVKPRQVSYIGRLAVGFPNRVRVGSPAQIRILDAGDETIEKLRAAHPSIVGKSVKDLATRGE